MDRKELLDRKRTRSPHSPIHSHGGPDPDEATSGRTSDPATHAGADPASGRDAEKSDGKSNLELVKRHDGRGSHSSMSSGTDDTSAAATPLTARPGNQARTPAFADNSPDLDERPAPAAYGHPPADDHDEKRDFTFHATSTQLNDTMPAYGDSTLEADRDEAGGAGASAVGYHSTSSVRDMLERTATESESLGAAHSSKTPFMESPLNENLSPGAEGETPSRRLLTPLHGSEKSDSYSDESPNRALSDRSPFQGTPPAGVPPPLNMYNTPDYASSGGPKAYEAPFGPLGGDNNPYIYREGMSIDELGGHDDLSRPLHSDHYDEDDDDDSDFDAHSDATVGPPPASFTGTGMFARGGRFGVGGPNSTKSWSSTNTARSASNTSTLVSPMSNVGMYDCGKSFRLFASISRMPLITRRVPSAAVIGNSNPRRSERSGNNATGRGGADDADDFGALSSNGRSLSLSFGMGERGSSMLFGGGPSSPMGGRYGGTTRQSSTSFGATFNNMSSAFHMNSSYAFSFGGPFGLPNGMGGVSAVSGVTGNYNPFSDLPAAMNTLRTHLALTADQVMVCNDARHPLDIRKGKMIGKGGFANVFVGVNTISGGLVAIKEILISDVNNRSELRNVEKEFALLKALQHANIVRYELFDHSASQKVCRIVMELALAGSTLGLLQRFGPLTESTLRHFSRGILHGIAFIHKEGISHRDIKPANILVSHTGQVKLCDFGGSKRINELNKATSCIIGTPVYMAPEFIRGNASHKADIWSIGCTLFELATGRLPWYHSGVRDNLPLMFYITTTSESPLVLPQDEAHDFSESFLDFLDRCFTRDAEARPEASELLKHPWLQDVSRHDDLECKEELEEVATALSMDLCTTVAVPAANPVTTEDSLNATRNMDYRMLATTTLSTREESMENFGTGRAHSATTSTHGDPVSSSTSPEHSMLHENSSYANPSGPTSGSNPITSGNNGPPVGASPAGFVLPPLVTPAPLQQYLRINDDGNLEFVTVEEENPAASHGMQREGHSYAGDDFIHGSSFAHHMRSSDDVPHLGTANSRGLSPMHSPQFARGSRDFIVPCGPTNSQLSTSSFSASGNAAAYSHHSTPTAHPQQTRAKHGDAAPPLKLFAPFTPPQTRMSAATSPVHSSLSASTKETASTTLLNEHESPVLPQSAAAAKALSNGSGVDRSVSRDGKAISEAKSAGDDRDANADAKQTIHQVVSPLSVASEEFRGSPSQTSQSSFVADGPSGGRAGSTRMSAPDSPERGRSDREAGEKWKDRSTSAYTGQRSIGSSSRSVSVGSEAKHSTASEPFGANPMGTSSFRQNQSIRYSHVLAPRTEQSISAFPPEEEVDPCESPLPPVLPVQPQQDGLLHMSFSVTMSHLGVTSTGSASVAAESGQDAGINGQTMDTVTSSPSSPLRQATSAGESQRRRNGGEPTSTSTFPPAGSSQSVSRSRQDSTMLFSSSTTQSVSPHSSTCGTPAHSASSHAPLHSQPPPSHQLVSHAPMRVNVSLQIDPSDVQYHIIDRKPSFIISMSDNIREQIASKIDELAQSGGVVVGMGSPTRVSPLSSSSSSVSFGNATHMHNGGSAYGTRSVVGAPENVPCRSNSSSLRGSAAPCENLDYAEIQSPRLSLSHSQSTFTSGHAQPQTLVHIHNNTLTPIVAIGSSGHMSSSSSPQLSISVPTAAVYQSPSLPLGGQFGSKSSGSASSSPVGGYNNNNNNNSNNNNINNSNASNTTLTNTPGGNSQMGSTTGSRRHPPSEKGAPNSPYWTGMNLSGASGSPGERYQTSTKPDIGPGGSGERGTFAESEAYQLLVNPGFQYQQQQQHRRSTRNSNQSGSPRPAKSPNSIAQQPSYQGVTITGYRNSRTRAASKDSYDPNSAKESTSVFPVATPAGLPFAPNATGNGSKRGSETDNRKRSFDNVPSRREKASAPDRPYSLVISTGDPPPPPSHTNDSSTAKYTGSENQNRGQTRRKSGSGIGAGGKESRSSKSGVQMAQTDQNASAQNRNDLPSWLPVGKQAEKQDYLSPPSTTPMDRSCSTDSGSSARSPSASPGSILAAAAAASGFKFAGSDGATSTQPKLTWDTATVKKLPLRDPDYSPEALRRAAAKKKLTFSAEEESTPKGSQCHESPIAGARDSFSGQAIGNRLVCPSRISATSPSAFTPPLSPRETEARSGESAVSTAGAVPGTSTPAEALQCARKTQTDPSTERVTAAAAAVTHSGSKSPSPRRPVGDHEQPPASSGHLESLRNAPLEESPVSAKDDKGATTSQTCLPVKKDPPFSGREKTEDFVTTPLSASTHDEAVQRQDTAPFMNRNPNEKQK